MIKFKIKKENYEIIEEILNNDTFNGDKLLLYKYHCEKLKDKNCPWGHIIEKTKFLSKINEEDMLKILFNQYEIIEEPIINLKNEIKKYEKKLNNPNKLSDITYYSILNFKLGLEKALLLMEEK